MSTEPGAGDCTHQCEIGCFKSTSRGKDSNETIWHWIDLTISCALLHIEA